MLNDPVFPSPAPVPPSPERPTAQPRAVLWDIDGVLLKVQDDQRKRLWSLTITANLGLTSAHFRAIFDHNWAHILRGRKELLLHLDQVFRQDIFKEVHLTPSDYIAYWLGRDQNLCQEVLAIASQLAVPCYLASNQEAIRARHLRTLFQAPGIPTCPTPRASKPQQAVQGDSDLKKDNPLKNANDLKGDINLKNRRGPDQEAAASEKTSLFQGAFFSCDLGAAKPEPAFFHAIARRLNLAPADLLLIDDMPSYIAGAQACGLQTYLYQGNAEDLALYLRARGLLKGPPAG